MQVVSDSKKMFLNSNYFYFYSDQMCVSICFSFLRFESGAENSQINFILKSSFPLSLPLVPDDQKTETFKSILI
jgi:hypothetical protein